MISLSSKGSFKKTLDFLNAMQRGDIFSELDRYGRMGVDALASATPVASGLTAQSWNYRVVNGKGKKGLVWYNTNTNDGANIAILIQYGHGTGTGGYVAGYDYINPAIRPIFDKLADDIWRKVTTA